MSREPTAETGEFILTFEAGETVFEEGDPGAEMFIIASGEVGIFFDQEGSAPVALLRAGDFFGEMALLEGGARFASARALSACRLLVIDASTFDQMIHRDPEIAIRMLRKLAHRLRTLPHHPRVPEVPAPLPAPQTPPAGAGPATASAGEVGGGPRLDHVSSGRSFVVRSDGETTVGRVDSAAGLRPDVDLDEIDVGRAVSRRHAKIHAGAGEYVVVEDLGAANPIFVNGKRLTKGVRAPISSGDRICFGTLELVFHCG